MLAKKRMTNIYEMNQFHSVLRTTKMLQNIGRKKNLQEIDPISMLQQW